jgi:hypothetical protein
MQARTQIAWVREEKRERGEFRFGVAGWDWRAHKAAYRLSSV